MALLSIVVPVYNEGHDLDALVRRFMGCTFPIPHEWIFVDDKSSDESLAVLDRLSTEFHFRVIRLPVNRGKGMAVRRGIEEAKGEVIVVQDADSEYDPKEIPNLVEPILSGRADVVYGSRFKLSSPQVHRTYHYFINRFLTVLSNLLSGIYLSDMETCYKAFRSDLLKAMALRSERFGIEVELTAYIAKTKARIFEIPISYFPRTRLEGKKINWKDGVAALAHLYRFNVGTTLEQAFPNLPEAYRPPYAKARPPK